MVDRDKVVRALENCVSKPKCRDCPWEECSNIGWDYDEIPHNLAQAVLEQLKAKPKRESMAMLPCRFCGAKQRTHWYAPEAEAPEGLKCSRCSYTVWGKNRADAVRKWNAVMGGNGDATDL